MKIRTHRRPHILSLEQPASMTSGKGQIASRVREARAGAQLHQAHVAVAMCEAGFNWYPQTISRVERGLQSIRAKELAPLADALNTSVTRLLGMSIAQVAAFPTGPFVECAVDRCLDLATAESRFCGIHVENASPEVVA